MDDPQAGDFLPQAGQPGYFITNNESPLAAPFRDKLAEWVAAGNSSVIGPGGRSEQGYPLSWLPYDPNQGMSGIGQGDSHTKFGPTYDDPFFGKLQSTYTEPSKAKRDRELLNQIVFGTALSAITAGAGSGLLAPLFKTAIGYGTTGSFDPKSIALSALTSAAGGFIPPELAQALSVGSKAYGIGKAGYEASRGNYGPGTNLAANAALGQIFGGP